MRVIKGVYVCLKSEKIYMTYDARGNGGGGITPTITGDHQNRVTDYTAIVLELVVEDQGGDTRSTTLIVIEHENDNTNREEVL